MDKSKGRYDYMSDKEFGKACEQHLEFSEKHQRADEIIMRKGGGFPLITIYYSPEGKHWKNTSEIMKMIRNITWDEGN